MGKETYIPVKQYAEEKGISVQAVYQSIWARRIESKKIGSYTLVKA